jgi:hypothetical protein
VSKLRISEQPVGPGVQPTSRGFLRVKPHQHNELAVWHGGWFDSCLGWVAKGQRDVQRHIELLIGRLVTDEDFRRAFQNDPQKTLSDAQQWGLALTAVEVSALLATDHTLWERIAIELDSRLQKASFRTS